MQRTLSAEELSRDVEGLAANDNDLLSLEELLSNGRGETTEEMALAIDGDLQYAPSASILSANVRSHVFRYSVVAVYLFRSRMPEYWIGGETHDLLEGRHFVLLFVRRRTCVGESKNVPSVVMDWRDLSLVARISKSIVFRVRVRPGRKNASARITRRAA